MNHDTTETRLAAALPRMPLFPLPNVVLFPHASLRLHIFEDRYRAMTRDILAGERFVAMGLIVEGASPSDERPTVEAIAGVGEVIMAHELPDGRFNLVLRGHARVRIDEELASDRPYRLVSASLLPDLPIADHNELRDAEQSLRVLIGQLADAIPEGGEPLRQILAALETPAALANVAAAELIADVGAEPHGAPWRT
jgi:Lon protease-like protein